MAIVNSEFNIKISLGLPLYDSIKAETCYCLLAALSNTPCQVHLNFRKGTYIHDARNFIVDEARSNNATHLMFIDSDIAFPVDGISKLLSHDVDIVAGNYSMKQQPPATTIRMRENGKFIAYDFNKFPKDKLFEVYGIGMGFMLIKMSVFDKLEKPFFHFKRYEDHLMGEDIYFAEKVNEAGMKILVDPTIKLAHIGDYAY